MADHTVPLLGRQALERVRRLAQPVLARTPVRPPVAEPRQPAVRRNGLTHISAPAGVAPSSGYTHVVTGPGRLAAIAGQMAFDEAGELVGADDPAAQARQVFTNMRRCLAAAGATFDDVIKLTYYVTDIAYVPRILAVRDEFVDSRRPPASTVVQVVALYRPDLLLEVDAFAMLATG
ncbi:MAG TPA: RidA family protein [Streptosporangiaceae bacterium]